jgi:putative N6-adenine-specific DNA methylase
VLAELNVWLRCANRVYLVLAEGLATDFDDLFSLTESIDWRKMRPKDSPIVVETLSVRSALTSEPAIQRTVKKAIVDSLIGRFGEVIPEVDSLPSFRVLVLIRGDVATILLDSSGDPLHKRGYRLEAGEAPIKETLAAAMIYLSNWRYREPLLDPCAGAGTIPIEAAMIARNIAPGLRRHFAFENWDWIDPSVLQEVRDTAKTKIYPPGGYSITGSDIDAHMMEQAHYNSKVAGVAADIVWNSADALTLDLTQATTIITNPPYGDRIETEDVGPIHARLLSEFRDRESLSGGVITNVESFISGSRKFLDRRKLWNGSIECQYCYRKEVRAK